MRAQSGMEAEEHGRIGVLLLHGLNGSPAELRFIANGLTREGITVVCPTLDGYSTTSAGSVRASWQDWYNGAEQSLEALYATCDRVIVGGLSTGAVLSLMLAANHPDKVHGLALYSPTLWLSGRSVPWYLPFFRYVSNKRFASFFKFPVPHHVGIKDARIREFIRNAARGAGPASTPGEIVVERRELCSAAMRLLDGITQPVLILHAREDDYAGLDNATYLQRQLSGPVDLVVLDDCYHMVTVDRQRHVVLDRTVEFVAREAGRAASTVMRGTASPVPSAFKTSLA